MRHVISKGGVYHANSVTLVIQRQMIIHLQLANSNIIGKLERDKAACCTITAI